MKRKNYKLVEAISEARLTQSELAKLSGISSESRLSRIIYQRDLPTSTEIEAICSVLKKTPSELEFDLGGVA